MELLLQISTKDALYEELYSRDISSQGVFVLTDTPFSEGTAVDVSVHIASSDKKNGEQQSMLKSSGKVIRVEKNGMAIIFDTDCRIFPKIGKKTH